MPKDDPRCQLCGVPLLWAKHISGQNMPLNREPDPEGTFFVINGDQIKADWAPEWDGPKYRSHRVTCAARNKLREAAEGGKQ